jgi:hypothetical protein
MMGAVTKDTFTDFGKRIQKEFDALKKKPYVKVGVTGAKASQKHEGEEATVAEIAVFNEFGTTSADGKKLIPARPFLRQTIDKLGAAWDQEGDLERKAVISGKQTVGKALARMGERIKKDIQETIRSDVPPPNAPSTIEAKTASLKGRKKRKAEIGAALGQGTLRNTGQLLNSISYMVVNESRD